MTGVKFWGESKVNLNFQLCGVRATNLPSCSGVPCTRLLGQLVTRAGQTKVPTEPDKWQITSIFPISAVLLFPLLLPDCNVHQCSSLDGPRGDCAE